MRLVESNFPSNYYTFSNYNRNTKLTIDISLNNEPMVITIQEGTYTPEQMATELSTIIENKLSTGNKFKVHYDIVSQKFHFLSDSQFTLKFKNESNYDETCNITDTFKNHINWGLPYNLGFDKKDYNSTDASFNLYYDDNFNNFNNTKKYNYNISAPYTCKMLGDRNIYMEVEKYNSYNELTPYFDISDKEMFDPYNGIVNSAFAKIPILSKIHNSYYVDSINNYTQNLTTFTPPLERLSKLKFKFRYHDGRLVDFNKTPFDFTIEFNTLVNEINKTYNVRIPSTYLL